MTRLLRKFSRRIAVLLIAVMVIVPVADAFSCSFEGEATHATVSADDHVPPTQDDGESPATHGVCSHNHCHHSTADVPSRLAIGPHEQHRIVLLPVDDDRHLASWPDDLMRPPRI